jgi:hypothetical protein
MRKNLLITAAALTASLVASGAGATAASAASTSTSATGQTFFCAYGFNSCLTYPYTAWDKGRQFLPVDIYPNPYVPNVLETSFAWPSPNFTNAGNYVVNGTAEPVSDINLGNLQSAGNNDVEYTCLSFTVNATGATVYAKYLGGEAWGVSAGDCM